MMQETLAILQSEGYFNIKYIDGLGICGLRRFIFTVGLVYGLDEAGYCGRYCFDEMIDARSALDNWNGVGDPEGNWIKHKGKIEYSNPKYGQEA